MQHGRLASPMLAGAVYSIIFLLAGTLIVSLLLALTGMKEQSLPVYSYIIHGIAIFAGGLAAGRRTEKKGWYHGLILGILYALIIMLISYFGFDSSIGYDYALILGIGAICGALGGAIGVNLSKR